MAPAPSRSVDKQHSRQLALPSHLFRGLSRLSRNARICLVVAAALIANACAPQIFELLRHWWRRRVLGLENGGTGANGWVDPMFGPSLGLVYRRDRSPMWWEDFLDAFDLPRESPSRDHIRQFFHREGFDEELRGLFDAIVGLGQKSLSKGNMELLSRGIKGHIRVLLQTSTRVDLLPCSEEDHQWILGSLEKVFTPEAPLDRAIFPDFLKVVLLRRIVRTLMGSVGLATLQEGMAAPLVVDVHVELSNGRPPFRIHTVAPASAPCRSSGERLGLIEESPSAATEQAINFT
eukprot:TRINITY_DN31644_c0_g1_i1.p1 TRINITY_DN31644_c0_g1~~TRINITY_DN31644_c0_g1_i1.p1  ORF type:complete len:326 (+),score=50.80 TRINITY_DN31644_c0_g1_i1:106-978(+)